MDRVHRDREDDHRSLASRHVRRENLAKDRLGTGVSRGRLGDERGVAQRGSTIADPEREPSADAASLPRVDDLERELATMTAQTDDPADADRLAVGHREDSDVGASVDGG